MNLQKTRSTRLICKKRNPNPSKEISYIDWERDREEGDTEGIP